MERVIRSWAERIFIFLFTSIFLVDSINGYLLNSNIDLKVSFGQAYRLITYSFLITMIIYKNKLRNIRLFLVINFVLVILLPFYSYFYPTSRGIEFDVLIIAKLLLPLYIIEAFKNMLRQNFVTRETLEKVFLYNMILIPISVLLPKVIGMGFTVYRGGAGFKGFYFANNDLNIVLLILFTYALFSLFTKSYSFKVTLIGILLTLTSLMLIGSKASFGFVGVILFVFIFSFFAKARKDLKIQINERASIVIVFCTIAIIGAAVFLRNEFSSIITRQLYNLSNQSLVTYIFSSRDQFLLAAINSFTISKNLFLELILGTGMYYRQELTAEFLGWGFTTVKGIEMDFFDILFSYGVIVTALIYSFYFKVFFRAVRKIKETIWNKFSIIGFLIIMLYSSVAGHVLFSAFAGTFLALVCCSLVIEYEGRCSCEEQYSSNF